jgi:Ca2+-binding EF-hand superfamily protein
MFGNSSVNKLPFGLVGPTDQELEEVFKILDYDKNREISYAETRIAVQMLNTRFSRAYNENDIIAFFTTLDSNHDGRITFDEFQRYFKNVNF